MSYMPKSKSDVHVTPDRVYDLIRDEWGYTKEDMFDPCPVNPKCDGLKIDWKDINYVNPPYSNLSDWVDKAMKEQVLFQRKSIMLLPSKTEQLWFHKLIESGYEIKWIRRRLKFTNNKHHATQPHFLVKIE